MAMYQCIKCGESRVTGDNHECKEDYYKRKFADIPVELKRKDLITHPMIDSEKIKKATDKEVEEVYYHVFSNFDMAMQEVLGGSMFDEE